MSTDKLNYAHQDIGYLLTAYADSQLVPDGVMWVEEQLDRNAELRAKLKEIRSLQAGLRQAFAGNAPTYALDLPRRDALLAQAGSKKRSAKNLSFKSAMKVMLAASICVVILGGIGLPVFRSVRPNHAYTDVDMELPPLRVMTMDAPAASAPTDTLAAFDVPEATGEKSTFGNRKDLDQSYGYARGLVNAGGPVGGLAPLGENKSAAPAQAPTGFTSVDGGGVYSPPLAKAEGGRLNNSLADDSRKSMDVAGKLAQPSVVIAQRNDRQMEQEKEVDSFAATTPSPTKPMATAAAPVVIKPSSPPFHAVRPQPIPTERQQLARKDSDKRPEPKQQGVTNDDRLERQVTEVTQIEKSDKGREDAKVSLESGGGGGGFALKSIGGEKAKNEKNVASKEPPTSGVTKKAVQRTGDELMVKGNYPKIANELTDEKVSASFFGGVISSVRNNPQNQQDLLMMSIGEGDKVSEGSEFIIIRDNQYIVRMRAEKVLQGIVAGRVIPESWNTNGLQVQQGDLAVDQLGGASELSGKQAYEWMTTSAKLDPRMSLATLSAPVTNDNTGRYGELLWMISGDKIAYQVTQNAQTLLKKSGLVQLRDEPVSRGVLRIARSVNLQAQFTGGIVHLDVAQRPLDPTDSQGFELPTFRTLMGTSPMQSIAIDPVQTVAIDADTASYAYAKARIAAGEMVDASTIKPEHFINAMPMDYPKALGPEAFSLYAEAAPSPFARAHTAWGARTALVSIGAVAKPAAADERRPLALTLAIDCSGSMAQPGALDRIKVGLQTLIGNLRAEDRVSIVAFGDQARVVLPATPGNDPNTVLAALQTLTTSGATNAAEGLTLAYQLAAETAAPGVESRVLLATDGGTVAGADDLLRRVTAFKDRGITLVVVGCGQTYRAGPLQELATKGDGQHFFVGSNDEAQTLFSTTLLPDRLAVLAKDAKLQVTWNPQRISHARLIGYDQRRLATKDFRDNSIDAGELSQDTQVTALFEVLLVDGGTGPLGNAAVRYYDTRREQVRELACPLPGSILASQPSDRLRLLACAATTAEWLQRGWWSNVHLITPAEITAQLKRCPQPIAAELRKMVEQKAE